MKFERSNVDFPLWRKKVDSSLFAHKGTTIPTWACTMWGIQIKFTGINSKRNKNSIVTIIFKTHHFDGWLTEASKGRITPAFRLWFSDDLLQELKDSFLMSYMRDIEYRLRNDKNINIEEEIPFWEFLDIEYDNKNNTFIFTPYYTQKPSFPELFKRLIGSPAIKKIDDETSKNVIERIYKQDWRPRSNYETEIGAENVIYMLIDTVKKYLYIGEGKNLVKRLNQGHKVISNWDYYRYDVLPNLSENFRLDIERMLIRQYATLLKNNKSIYTMDISKYKLVNQKIDK